jgi:hypothetical protein
MRVCLFFAFSLIVLAQRPPAVPLVTHDPYFSIWSMSDQVNTSETRHWTGSEQPLGGFVSIDGKGYRFLGGGRDGAAMKQMSVQVTPTRTLYRFEQDPIKLDLLFFTPAFMESLDTLSRPVTYVSVRTASTDGKSHRVNVYFDMSYLTAVNSADQAVTAGRFEVTGVRGLRVGSVGQPLLARSGDNLRIDWGHAYLGVSTSQAARLAITDTSARKAFVERGEFPDGDDLEPRPNSSRKHLRLAAMFDLGLVEQQGAERVWMLAYDDGYSIEYLDQKLKPWWRRNGMTMSELLTQAARDYNSLAELAVTYDQEMMKQLTEKGGEQYAYVATLAYRQALAAHKLVADLHGRPFYFSKENFSNGCIATVDVTYPSAPLFLWKNVELLKGMMTPVFEYARLPRWKFPFAPHDLGTYPLANGQVYGGGERDETNQMPVEESGNMILLTAAIAEREGNAGYAKEYWPLLKKWAQYLAERGLDPENQLNTDDFAGHTAHNANLSLKAILALGAYAKLASQLGQAEDAATYRTMAREFAAKWVEMAKDGDHYKLTFDQPGTWSQKYNLVWDKLLNLNLFSADVARAEIAYYLTKQNAYGLPLDSRRGYTKLDWIVWTATMAERKEDFEALIGPMHKFLNESKSRVPMTDWYETVEGVQRGFQARSVVGGVFIKMLQ